MITHRFLALCLSVAVLVSAPRAIAQQEMVAHWNRPFEPFRIIGNVHYVGTNELGAYLITSKEGHALIDGGFAETAPLILASIRALGFDPKDVKMLLTTQAHMDHVGSMAGLKAATGAQTVIMEQDAAVMERGGQRDFTFGDSFTFPPVRVDRRLKDGAMVRVGDTTLTARLTAGHTQGCTTWTMTADDGGRRVNVVFAGSLTLNPPVRLVINPSYPGIAEDYERSFALMRALPTDVFLGAHAGFFALHDKAKRLRKGERPNPFIDPAGFRTWVADMERQFRARIDKEQSTQTGSGAGAAHHRFARCRSAKSRYRSQSHSVTSCFPDRT